MIPPSDRILLFAGSSLRELRAQLAVDDQALLQRNDIQRPPSGGPYRLAIVNANAQRLDLARRSLAALRPRSISQAAISDPRTRIARAAGSVANAARVPLFPDSIRAALSLLDSPPTNTTNFKTSTFAPCLAAVLAYTCTNMTPIRSISSAADR